MCWYFHSQVDMSESIFHGFHDNHGFAPSYLSHVDGYLLDGLFLQVVLYNFDVANIKSALCCEWIISWSIWN